MADFFESNLCRPTAPREIHFVNKKKLRKENPKAKDKRNSAFDLFHRFVNSIHTHSKKYSRMKNETFLHVGEDSHSAPNWIEEKAETKAPPVQSPHNSYETKEKKGGKRMKLQLLLRAHLASKGKGHVEDEFADETSLLLDGSPDFGHQQTKRRRRKRPKSFIQTRQEVCQRAFEESKKVLKNKRRSIRKGCINWAYSVASLSATGTVCMPAMGTYPSFQQDHVFYFSPDPKRTFY